MLVAVDTGATKTLVAGFGKDGVLKSQVKFPTPKSHAEYLVILTENLKKQFDGKHIDAIVVGTPGTNKNGVILWGGGNLPWKNFNLVSQLSKTFNGTPIFLENDANLAGLGETRFLHKIPAQSLYVTVSTGIGSGIITGGRINPSLRNSEAGHALIEYGGKVQDWEKFASGQAILKTYGKYARDIKNKRTWSQIADRISRGFLAIIPILQPDVIILGGSIGTYFDRYADHLVSILKEKLPPHIPCPEFKQAKYPELAVIYGCYYYGIDKLADKKA
jgi:predicted NBD/HSP70 family sugar kinase